MTDTNLHNKIALVTGGGRGIGNAIALALAEEGCDVAVNYVSREADARQTAEAIEALGRRSLVVRGDVAKSADVAALVAAVEKQLGPVDILVNNAGRAAFESLEQMTEASWNDTIQVNLTSVFLMTQAVLPGMRARKWGRVINLTSVAAQAGSVLAVHYSAAKAGVIAATKSYARLLAKEGVTVNAISPALIGTEMVASNPHIKPDMIPVGRFGRVEECADVAVLLARNGYITGQTISVNGGMYFAA
ncbi:MAG TPA: 3-oxoacyl-ACP reductase family protein, partial [Gammaproteobacteria bacterium]|nr:3-oxoacyl-ACP reductase family protein [Gammaproteobacteria bacterium]